MMHSTRMQWWRLNRKFNLLHNTKWCTQQVIINNKWENYIEGCWKTKQCKRCAKCVQITCTPVQCIVLDSTFIAIIKRSVKIKMNKIMVWRTAKLWFCNRSLDVLQPYGPFIILSFVFLFCSCYFFLLRDHLVPIMHWNIDTKRSCKWTNSLFEVENLKILTFETVNGVNVNGNEFDMIPLKAIRSITSNQFLLIDFGWRDFFRYWSRFFVNSNKWKKFNF